MTASVNYPNQQNPSYSGVTINITNPTVNAGNQTCPPTVQLEQPLQQVTNPIAQTPINNNVQQESPQKSPEQAQIQSYPPQYYLNNYNIQNGKKALEQPDTQDVDMTASSDIINNLDTKIDEENELKKNSKEKRVVALTNEYIMSLENYLNNPNTEIRLMAAKEILKRLDEDKERYDDAALNALLNKMLQDPDKLVRIAAMSAFSSQLAGGNEFTVQLLNKIQNDPNAEKEDVLEAANILLKMSAPSEIKYVPQKDKPQNETQTKLEEPQQ